MFCGNCGNQVPDSLKFCPNCGFQMQQQMQQYEQPQMPVGPTPAQNPTQQQSLLRCPACGCQNVSVQIVEQGQMTTKKGFGFGGHMNNAARGVTAVATLGVSNLFWKKSRGTNKTKTINATMAICQGCGNVWEIEGGKFGSAPSSIVR